MASNDLRRAVQLLQPLIDSFERCEKGAMDAMIVDRTELSGAEEAARLIEAYIPSEGQQPIIVKSMIEETVGDMTFRAAAETPDEVLDLMMMHKRACGQMSAEQWERWLAEKGARDTKKTAVSGGRRNGVSGEWVEPPPDKVDVQVWASGFPKYEFTVGDGPATPSMTFNELRESIGLPPLGEPLTVAGWTFPQWCLAIAVTCVAASALFGLYYWIVIH